MQIIKLHLPNNLIKKIEILKSDEVKGLNLSIEVKLFLIVAVKVMGGKSVNIAIEQRFTLRQRKIAPCLV